jgi:hypothetical protein
LTLHEPTSDKLQFDVDPRIQSAVIDTDRSSENHEQIGTQAIERRKVGPVDHRDVEEPGVVPIGLKRILQTPEILKVEVLEDNDLLHPAKLQSDT